jgi:hypothetical protein
MEVVAVPAEDPPLAEQRRGFQQPDESTDTELWHRIAADDHETFTASGGGN